MAGIRTTSLRVCLGVCPNRWYTQSSVELAEGSLKTVSDCYIKIFPTTSTWPICPIERIPIRFSTLFHSQLPSKETAVVHLRKTTFLPVNRKFWQKFVRYLLPEAITANRWSISREHICTRTFVVVLLVRKYSSSVIPMKN